MLQSPLLLLRSLRSSSFPAALLRVHLPSTSRPFSLTSRRLDLLPGSSVTEDFAVDIPPNVYVSSVSPAGVELGEPGVVVPGAAILLAGKAFLWNVALPKEGDSEWRGFGEEVFRVFEVVGPRPGEHQEEEMVVTSTSSRELTFRFLRLTVAEMLILGTGPTVLHPPPWIRTYFASLGIQLDVMSTVRSSRSLSSQLSLPFSRPLYPSPC